MVRQFVVRVGAFCALAVAAACGDSGEGGAPAKSGTGRSAAPAAPPNRCPLTAEQVTAAVGAPVTGPDTSCSFFPPPAAPAARPNAAFVLQVSIACTGNVPAENGYKERLEGLGVQAYVADMADGSWVLVCRERAPFEVRVDRAGVSAAREAATTLARQVLARP